MLFVQTEISQRIGEKERVDRTQKQFADFPQRLEALDAFARAYAEFAPVRGALDDAADLKRLLRGSGVLEVHILVDYDPANPPASVR